jgi:hypothetical protein
VINGHSVEIGQPGELKFIISHRFGAISGGAYELFGLDASYIRFGLDYALNKRTDIGVGRSSEGKVFDAYFKRKLTYQKSGGQNFPFTIVYLATSSFKSEKWVDGFDHYLSDRFRYSHQLLIGRKVSDRFSFQIMPTLVHKNLVNAADMPNDIYALGLAGRYQVTKAMAVQFEHYHILPGMVEDNIEHSISIGFEFQTKAHVFQVHLSNSTGMTETMFITETTQQWKGLEVGLGFNITRDFKIVGRDYL